ncbi:MAG: hypothetical protein SPK64_00455, partial [Candidatus Enterosoma sp.]|nr:hypothetical protein [Candidatus Enterosoma sp.]
YREFEITDTLADLPMSSVTGEDVFYYIYEQDKSENITDKCEEIELTKNITLWVREATGGVGPEKV